MSHTLYGDSLAFSTDDTLRHRLTEPPGTPNSYYRVANCHHLRISKRSVWQIGSINFQDRQIQCLVGFHNRCWNPGSSAINISSNKYRAGPLNHMIIGHNMTTRTNDGAGTYTFDCRTTERIDKCQVTGWWSIFNLPLFLIFIENWIGIVSRYRINFPLRRQSIFVSLPLWMSNG